MCDPGLRAHGVLVWVRIPNGSGCGTLQEREFFAIIEPMPDTPSHIARHGRYISHGNLGLTVSRVVVFEPVWSGVVGADRRRATRPNVGFEHLLATRTSTTG